MKAILERKAALQKTALCYHSRFIMQDRDRKENLLLQKDEKGRPEGVDLVYRDSGMRFHWTSVSTMLSECALRQPHSAI